MHDVCPLSYRGGVSVQRGPCLAVSVLDPLDRDTPRGQTYTCENITFPETSFAGGNEFQNCPFGHICCQFLDQKAILESKTKGQNPKWEDSWQHPLLFGKKWPR